ncbi:amino acid adenylation domain-containing protein [Acinetobacter corruptisaponis]|uniref:Amino acid adenylation domain-containing protein n=1 Tax=Acinetobacter corruptisaponis TaxID=3045147 RepID=A0ABY8S447_9GAMM|nr:non-ribosomal peptide synthetase [Acinetobacter sp. KCTC 92772]WHP06166.1 amino acid adenylation domain-containing protein [Acinetobacter sp. KCTC 92772]
MNQALQHEFTQEPIRLNLLSTQQGIFLADHLSSIEDLYTIAHCLELPKSVDLTTFKQAIEMGLSEADTVTARYSCDPAHPFFQLNHNPQIQIEEFDFCHLSPAQAQKRLWDWMPTDREYAKSLKNNDSHLYRQVLFICHDKVYWYQRYHHIMLDGFSIINLTKRIVGLYQQLQQQTELKASPFITVTEVIAERQAYENSSQFQVDQDFWTSYCQDLPTPVTLSTHHLAAKTTAKFIKHQLHFSQGILAQIQLLAAHAKLALPDIMMALSLHYLHRMTDKSELVMGIPFMRRLGSKAIRSLLPTVNVLPVKFSVTQQQSWLDLAQHVQAQLNQIRPHQKYDAEQILRDLNSIDVHERIYGTILNYKAFDQDLVIDDQVVKTHHISTGPIDDFEFSFIVQNQELIIELRADALRYSQDELLMHSQRLTLLLEQCLAQPEHACATFSITTKQEQQLLTQAGTGIKVTHPECYNNVLDIFYEQAQKYPERIAILSGERDSLYQLTFAELKTQINQLTRFLQANGAKKHTVIAGAIPRSAESVVMMLSVLNSGASFLPLDLDYPTDRMQMMCEDANPLFVLTTQALTQQLPQGLTQIYLDDASVREQIQQQDPSDITAEQRRFDFQDVAYVIFTSGSTGRPKGVMNTHGSLLNLILSHQHTIYFPVLEAVQQRFPERPLRAAHTHSFSFDSSWLQVFWLLWGQELHIFDENMRRDAYGLVQEIQQRKIDTLDLPPSFCAQMISNGLFTEHQHHPSLILIGGEAAPLALWQQLNAQPNLFAHNLYGPTEYTVDTFRAELKLTERPVIANPIGNTQAYVLDQNLQRCPIGVIGELYISGFGIANGYLGRADLSSTRFVANPFEQGQRMYRTGDLVRWNMAGKLEFMGRCDDQIKIRGYRVEIGEVENALSILPDIESVVVIAEPINNSHRLLGYCVVKDIQLDEAKSEQLSQHYLSLLRQNLPDYMVPSALTVMQEFPRNVSGKVDKKALPKPQIRSQSRVAQTPEQKLLCQIAASVLKLEQIGIDDDFFMTGGDSISAIMLCTQLRQHGYGLKPSDVFQLKTVAAMLTQLEALEIKSNDNNIQQVFDDALIEKVQQHYAQDSIVLPLLPLHKGMLFHSQIEQQHASYNAFTRLSLNGEIDLIQLQQALTNVLRKHPQLGGCFDSNLHDEPIFVYSPNPTQMWLVEQYDCQAGQLEHTIEQVLQQPMQLDQPYGLIRAVLIQHNSQQSELILMVHHLLTDGWSTPLFMQDFIQAYQKPEQSLTVPAHSYADVILQLVQQDHSLSKQIWQQDLAHVQPLVLFEHAKQHSIQETAHHLSLALSATLQQKLRQTGITLNVFMQMIWAMCLQIYAHREDLIFGTPVAGRSAPINGLDQQIGLFLNTIPVRVQLNMQQNLWQQLQHLQQLHIRHLEHDGLGLNEIQQQLGLGSLFDSLLVVENYPDHQYLQQTLGSAKIEKLTNRGYSHYPLALLVIPDQQIELLLEQRGVIAQPEQFLQRIEQLIEIALNQPETALHHYLLQVNAEEQFIQQINQTNHDVPQTTLQQLLRTQALRNLDLIALCDEQQQLTFAQVRQQVCALAKVLQRSGVQAGDIVAIALPRSVKLSLAILAVIEAGAAYLPIDIQHPVERIKYMLEDAKPRLTISEQDVLPEIETPRFDFDALFDAEDISLTHYKISLVSPQHPAYVIYTSGTTGQPKGVMVSHQAIVNRILWMQDQYPLDHKDTILQKTPCSFDVSVWEFFWSYLVGARLVMAAVDAHRDPMALLNVIQQNDITTLHFVPSMLAVFENAAIEFLTDEQRQALPLKRVFCSGEALPTALAQSFNQHFSCELHNLYGPTEAAVDVSYMDARQPQAMPESSIAIGYPVWNTQLYILDQYLRPQPIGAEGELYLAGDQLAIGYLQRSDLTATRFVANPFLSGQRMYRTGDIARWNADGSIQYVGRADDQLKIRGQRIELGEIEQQLRLITQIDEVVVHPVANDQNAADIQLVAYLKTTQPLDANSLKKRLAKNLPAYMIPNHLMTLETFPLSHNGKLDRKALPQPQTSHTLNSRLPSSEAELKLEQIFQNILALQRRIKVEEDFFALGGHSILAMKLTIEIKKAFDRSLAVNQIMTGANIEKLAEQLQLQSLINQASDDAGFDTTFIIRQAKTKPVFCIYPGSGLAWQYSVLNRYLHPDISLIGLQSPRPNGALVYSQTMDELIDHQLKQVLEIQSDGPFTFLGYSLGGTIAYGLADRLQRLGHEVAFVGLLDTYPAEIHDWDMQNADAVTEEAEQEQIQFFNQVLDGADEVLNEEKDSLQDYIFANYRDAVRLLSQHQTSSYAGKIHVFVADQSLPDYIQPLENWQPFVNELEVIRLPEASHENLLSPEQLTTLGPLLNDYLSQVYQLKDAKHEV